MSLNAWIFEHTFANMSSSKKTTSPKKSCETRLIGVGRGEENEHHHAVVVTRVDEARFTGSTDVALRNTPIPVRGDGSFDV